MAVLNQLHRSAPPVVGRAMPVFQTVGQASTADVPQSVATGTKGCSLAGFMELAVTCKLVALRDLDAGQLQVN